MVPINDFLPGNCTNVRLVGPNEKKKITNGGREVGNRNGKFCEVIIFMALSFFS